VITVPPRHHKDQTQVRPADELVTVSAGSLPPVLNLNAAEQPTSVSRATYRYVGTFVSDQPAAGLRLLRLS
jgi:hypothetical protein